MKFLLLIITLSFSLLAHSSQVEYKLFPEFTGEVKEISSGQALGIKSDPNRELSETKNDSMLFLKTLDHAVIQLHKGCGAVLTSNTGYAITALHCLNDLPRGLKSPLLKKTLVDLGPKESVTTFAANTDMINYEYRRWAFNTVRLPDHKDILPLKLITFGNGYPILKKSWKHSDDLVIQNSELIKEHIDDYAVIKLNKMPENTKCVKAAESMPDSGSLTWAAGYPVHTRHSQIYLTAETVQGLIFKSDFFAPEISELFKKAKNLINKSKDKSWFPFEANQHTSPFYVAVGRAFKDYKELTKTFNYPIENENEKLFDLVTDSNKYFVSTSFNKPGFSGGGIFNTNKELIGINAMAPSTPTFLANKLQPLMSHVRIDYIKEQVKEKLGPEMAKEIFDCEELKN